MERGETAAAMRPPSDGSHQRESFPITVRAQTLRGSITGDQPQGGPMTSLFPRANSLALGMLAAAAALMVAACGTGPIPGQSGSTTTTSSSGTSSSGGCTAANAQTSVTVEATNALTFVPASVCLKVGGSITWKNTGNLPHTTTDLASLAANPANAELPAGATGWNHALQPGVPFTLKFTVAGTYKYFCIPHELLGMLGQITVVS